MIRFVCLLIFICQPVFAASINIINLGEDFRQFDEQATVDPEHIWEAWDQFEAKHQELYDLFVFKKNDPAWETNRIRRLNNFFGEYDTLKDEMDRIFKQADTIALVQVTRFKLKFPELRDDTPVVFMPSIFSFNGKAGYIQSLGRDGLLIGVDAAVLFQDDIDVLFSHEFFHVHHFNQLDENKVWLTMFSPLWFEGMATYVSGELNPGKSDAALLMDDMLAKKCSDSLFLKTWAKDFLMIADTSLKDPSAVNLQKEWFQGSGIYQPTRRGYCLGLQVMRDLQKKYSVDEMIHWTESQFAPIAKAALQKISAP